MRILVPPGTPAVVEALLALSDWSLDTQLQLVLPASVPVGPATFVLDPVQERDEDWDAIEKLFRTDHIEEDRRAGRSERPSSETRAAVLLRRGLTPAAAYFTVSRDSRVVGCIGVWVRHDGIGMIEDVFVHPDARGEGIATQMLRFVVGFARERGVGPVLIGAEVDDTPKHLYARFGFRPAAVTRSYTAPARPEPGSP
jgi:GNAT superfamily N-acetyltransferase